MIRLSNLVCGLFFLLVADLCGGQELPDAKQLVDLYGQAIVGWDLQVSMKVQTSVYFTGDLRPDPDVGCRKAEFIHRRSGEQAEWFGVVTYFEDDGTDVPLYTRQFRHVMDDTRSVNASRVPSHESVFHGSVTDTGYAKELLYYSAEPCRGGFLHGPLDGSGEARNVADLLSKSDSLRVASRENIRGTDCYVLTADTKYGTVSAWIAPDLGHNALRVELVKNKPHHLFREGVLLKGSPLNEFSLVIDSIDVQRVGDVFVPVSGECRTTHTLSGGERRETRIEVKRSDIDLNPDFKALGAFALNFPDGSKIQHLDFDGANYEVQGGKLVPRMWMS